MMMIPAEEIPYIELGDAGQDLHFHHANGFPVETYSVLLRQLTDRYRIIGMNSRPMWPDSKPTDIDNWSDLVDDLIYFLEARARPGIIGAGHSLGGVVTAYAAVRRPDLFRAIILVDPVFLTVGTTLFWRLLNLFGLEGLLPLARIARKRRAHWSSPEEILERYRQAPNFSRFVPEVLNDYVMNCTVPAAEGGVHLKYSPDWEARIFEKSPYDHWRIIPKIPCPCLIIRGVDSDTILPAAAQRIKRVLPQVKIVDIPGTGHFVPMEKPDEVAVKILEFLAAL